MCQQDFFFLNFVILSGEVEHGQKEKPLNFGTHLIPLPENFHIGHWPW